MKLRPEKRCSCAKLVHSVLQRAFWPTSYKVSLITRDMDLLIPRPTAIKARVDVAESLKDLGFVVGFTGSKGYIRLQHP
jgi:hypothetical protein